jgi:hypothetical protein
MLHPAQIKKFDTQRNNKKYDTQRHNKNVTLGTTTLNIDCRYSDCCCAECRFGECRCDHATSVRLNLHWFCTFYLYISKDIVFHFLFLSFPNWVPRYSAKQHSA